MARRGPKRPQDLKDWHLWSEVKRTVDPLPRQKPRQKKREHPEFSSLDDFTVTPGEPEKIRPPRTVPRFAAAPYMPKTVPDQAHDNSRIDPKLRRKLARGRLPIDATIDLHGMRQSEAYAALCRFIAARHARGDRTILVITGKGLKKTGFGMIEQRGVLRHMLPLWLNEPMLAPLVAGYEVSHQAHGGEGAWYVRLKRSVR